MDEVRFLVDLTIADIRSLGGMTTTWLERGNPVIGWEEQTAGSRFGIALIKPEHILFVRADIHVPVVGVRARIKTVCGEVAPLVG